MWLLVAILMTGIVGKADGAAAAGRERDQVDAAGSESGQRDGIVAGRVHEHESRRGDALGVVDGILHWRSAGFCDGAERLFEDVRESARFVAGRRIVIEASAEAVQILLVAS